MNFVRHWSPFDDGLYTLPSCMLDGVGSDVSAAAVGPTVSHGRGVQIRCAACSGQTHGSAWSRRLSSVIDAEHAGRTGR